MSFTHDAYLDHLLLLLRTQVHFYLMMALVLCMFMLMAAIFRLALIMFLPLDGAVFLLASTLNQLPYVGPSLSLLALDRTHRSLTCLTVWLSWSLSTTVCTS